MKKIASALTALALAAPVATTASADELSVSTSIAFESRYIFRGIEFAETSFQPGIDLAYGNFYGGVWLNLPVGDDDGIAIGHLGGAGVTEELDFFAGYSSSLNDVVSYDVGVTLYTFPNGNSGLFDMFSENGTGTGTSTVEAFLGFSLDTFLAPSIYFYRDFNFNTFTVEGSAGYSYPISESVSFDVAGALGYVVDDDPADYLYGSVSADFAYAISDDSAITLGARFGGSDIDGGSFIDDSIAGTSQSTGFWWGVGFSSDF